MIHQNGLAIGHRTPWIYFALIVAIGVSAGFWSTGDSARADVGYVGDSAYPSQVYPHVGFQAIAVDTGAKAPYAFKDNDQETIGSKVITKVETYLPNMTPLKSNILKGVQLWNSSRIPRDTSGTYGYLLETGGYTTWAGTPIHAFVANEIENPVNSWYHLGKHLDGSSGECIEPYGGGYLHFKCWSRIAVYTQGWASNLSEAQYVNLSLHELGHALGTFRDVGDVNNPRCDTVMGPCLYQPVTFPTFDDRRNMRRVYGIPEAGVLRSTPVSGRWGLFEVEDLLAAPEDWSFRVWKLNTSTGQWYVVRNWDNTVDPVAGSFKVALDMVALAGEGTYLFEHGVSHDYTSGPDGWQSGGWSNWMWFGTLTPNHHWSLDTDTLTGNPPVSAADLAGTRPMSVVSSPTPSPSNNTFLKEAFKYTALPQHLIATQTTLNPADFTLSAWVRLDSVPTSNWRHPLGLGDQHKATFYVSPNTSTLYYKFSFLGGQAEYIVGTLETGVWAHLVVTYDQDTWAFNVWLNGTWRGSATRCCGINFGGADAVLGLPDPLLWGNTWPGMVDEVMIFGYTLPADAAQSLYSWGIPPTAPD